MEMVFLLITMVVFFVLGYYLGSRRRLSIEDGVYLCQRGCEFTVDYIEYYLKKDEKIKIKNRISGCSIVGNMTSKNGLKRIVDVDVSIPRAIHIIGADIS